MAINYTIHANIYDINLDTPKKEDIIFVDTNVWFWTTYTKATQLQNCNIALSKSYINYINQALSVSALLVYSPLVYAELAHIIAKNELALLCKQKSVKIKPKEFRHNYKNEWIIALNEAQIAIEQIKNLAIPLMYPPDDDFMNRVYKNQKSVYKMLDIYDIIYVEQMNKERIDKIVTDDGDFSTIPFLNVFTANINVINTANRAGRLKKR